MATKKTNTTETEKATTKPKATTATAKNKEIKELKDQLNNTDSQLKEALEIIKSQESEKKETRNEIEELKKLMLQMSINNNNSNNEKSEDDDEELFEVATRFINGVGLFDPRREVEKEIRFNRPVEIDKNEMRTLLKSNKVKDMFEKDLVYFKDNNLYKKFRLKKKMDLSDEWICEMVENNSADQIRKIILEITKNNKDSHMYYALFYRFFELECNGKISRIEYKKRQVIEAIFKMKFEDARRYHDSFKERVDK